MAQKIFNNRLLLALSKNEVEKTISDWAKVYTWNIATNKDNIVINICTINEELLETYKIHRNDQDEILLKIEIHIGTKIVNLPFYFMLYLFYEDAHEADVVIKYSVIYQKTSIDTLKKFHSIIKTTHLQETIKKLKKAGHNENSIILLDLCSGKGNDMSKWHSMGLKKIVGVDINEESIIDARYRYLAKNYSSGFNVKFIKSDVGTYDADLNSYLDRYLLSASKTSRKFDIISCNFAIHYLFKHADNLRNFMAIINKYLNVGGYFIGTTLNKDLILKLFNKQTENFNAPLLEIIPKTHFFDEKKIYGRKYGIRIGLQGENTYFSKDESNEYLVDFNELRSVGFKNGLVMTEFANFKTLYKNNIDMSEDEKLPSFLNAKFTFYKQFIVN